MHRELRLIATIFIVCILAAGCKRSDSESSAAASVSPQPSPISAEKSDVDTVPFCELLRRPKEYHKKLIRTEAIIMTTFESATLYDPRCLTKDNGVHVETNSDEAFEAVRRNMKFEAHKGWRVKVTIVGRLEGPSRRGFGHLNFARFRFDVTRVENTEPVPADVPYPLDIIRHKSK